MSVNYPLRQMGQHHVLFVASARLMNGHDLEGLPGRETLAFPDQTIGFDCLDSASDAARQFADAIQSMGLQVPEMEVVEIVDGLLVSRTTPLPLLRPVKL